MWLGVEWAPKRNLCGIWKPGVEERSFFHTKGQCWAKDYCCSPVLRMCWVSLVWTVALSSPGSRPASQNVGPAACSLGASYLDSERQTWFMCVLLGSSLLVLFPTSHSFLFLPSPNLRIFTGITRGFLV